MFGRLELVYTSGDSSAYRQVCKRLKLELEQLELERIEVDKLAYKQVYIELEQVEEQEQFELAHTVVDKLAYRLEHIRV